MWKQLSVLEVELTKMKPLKNGMILLGRETPTDTELTYAVMYGTSSIVIVCIN